LRCIVGELGNERKLEGEEEKEEEEGAREKESLLEKAKVRFRGIVTVKNAIVELC
jgi:hypothetical protein